MGFLKEHAYGVAELTHGFGFEKKGLLNLAGTSVLGGSLQAAVIGGIYGGISDEKTAWEGIKTVAPYTIGSGLGINAAYKNFSNNYARGLKALGANSGKSAIEIGEHGKSLRSSFFSGFAERF